LGVAQFTAPAVVANATVTVGTASASDSANATRVRRCFRSVICISSLR